MSTPTAKHHLLITGTGRAGTTLLVELLEHLGLETRVDHDRFDEVANAGLEWSLTDPDPPYVVKNPKASVRLRRWIESGLVEPEQLDAVLIPMRDLSQAARSRAEVSFSRRRVGAPGGLDGVRWARRQDLELGRQLADLLLTVAEYEIPHILLAFPRFARDRDYCRRVLGPVLPAVDEQTFAGAWDAVVRPELVHDYGSAKAGLVETTRLYVADGVRRARRKISGRPSGDAT
jgi:hypothetical protein